MLWLQGTTLNAFAARLNWSELGRIANVAASASAAASAAVDCTEGVTQTRLTSWISSMQQMIEGRGSSI